MSASFFKLQGVGSFASEVYYFHPDNSGDGCQPDNSNFIWLFLNAAVYGTSSFCSGISTVDEAKPYSIRLNLGSTRAVTALSGSSPGHTGIADFGSSLKDPLNAATVRYSISRSTLHSRSIVASGGGELVDAVVDGWSVWGSNYATPSAFAGYVFAGWKYSNGAAVAARTGITIDAATNKLTIAPSLAEDISVYASFIVPVFNVSAYSSDGGTVELFVDGVKQAGLAGVSLTGAHTIKVVATPAFNYTFTGWIGSGIAGSASQTYEFALPGNDVTVSAVFTRRPLFGLYLRKVNPGGGTVTLTAPDGVRVENSGGYVGLTAYTGVEYVCNAVVSDTLTRKFVGWYDAETGGTLLSASASYAVTFSTAVANTTLWAVFGDLSNYSLASKVTDDAAGGYTAGNPAEAAGNAVSVTPTTPDFAETGNFLENREMTLASLPAAGWRIAQWFIDVDGAASVETIPASGAACPQQVTVTLTADTEVHARFAVNKYSVTADVDAPSSGAGTATVEYEVSSGVWAAVPEAGVTHGAKVRVTATPGAGYAAGGIFEGGSLVSDVVVLGDGIYNITAIGGDRSFVVKFKATVGMFLSLESAGLGAAVAKNAAGETIITATGETAVEAQVTLGDVITLVGTQLTGGFFKGWFLPADTTFLTPLTGLGLSASVTVTGNAQYVARFEDAATQLYVAVFNTPYGLGALSSSAGTEISQDDYETWLGGSLGIGENAGSDRYYQFSGVTDTIFSVTPLTDANLMKWQYRTVHKVGMSVTLGEWEDLGTGLSFSTSVIRNMQFQAVYYSSVLTRVQALYRSAANSSMGTMALSPSGNNASSNLAGVSGEFTLGTAITANAFTANGYYFTGWYTAASGGTLVSALPSYDFTLSEPLSLYAGFAQDTDAIYKFEGGTENKLMEWRSKRYVATKPFNPSCARVYASSYPNTLSLFTASSPDSPSSTTPSVAVSARSQLGFRLPVARPEKYVELEVKASDEVTEVAISTSMEGLAQ